MQKQFMSRADGDKYLNYLVVWTDTTKQKHTECYHTRKEAENSEPYLDGIANIYTRKQFNK